MKLLPDKLGAEAAEIKKDYERKGWRDVAIGWPDYSENKEPSVFVYATTPGGERKHWIFISTPSVLATIRSHFEAEQKLTSSSTHL